MFIILIYLTNHNVCLNRRRIQFDVTTVHIAKDISVFITPITRLSFECTNNMFHKGGGRVRICTGYSTGRIWRKLDQSIIGKTDLCWEVINAAAGDRPCTSFNYEMDMQQWMAYRWYTSTGCSTSISRILK